MIERSKMLTCSKKNKIYVICPANVKTGGTELLHQLVNTLNSLEFRAHMIYIGKNKRTKIEIPKEFKKYISSYKILEQIEDKRDNIVILPEVYVNFNRKIKQCKIIVWWLSVDNYLLHFNLKTIINEKTWKRVVEYFVCRNWRFEVSKINKRFNYNLAQSFYAIDFLKTNKFENIEYLSDYINKEYFNLPLEKKRENIVLYNPKKGYEFTEKIIKKSKDIKWIPLINMSNLEVRDTLLKSKVYIDFGNHPGKDRFPREAAICGCCIITGKKGAANFYEDIPIPDKYKFNDDENSISDILDTIRKCLVDYEKCFGEYEGYRNMIKNEPKKFVNDVIRVFKE